MTDSSTPIPAADVRPADVLLYHGTSWISKAIRLFDGTDVSHASLKVEDDEVDEALAKGVVEDPLAKSVQDSTYVLARRLKDTPTADGVTKLLAAARGYLGAPYAYHEILLLAFLCTVRKVKVTSILSRLLEGILAQAADLLGTIVSDGKKPLICSEFVYRSYSQALPGALVVARAALVGAEAVPPGIHPDSLLGRLGFDATAQAIAGPAPESLPAADLEELFNRYTDECKAAVEPEAIAFPTAAVVAQLGRYAGLLHRSLEPAAEALTPEAATKNLLDVAADFVTPGDLLKSESLMTLGRLS